MISLFVIRSLNDNPIQARLYKYGLTENAGPEIDQKEQRMSVQDRKMQDQ